MTTITTIRQLAALPYGTAIQCRSRHSEGPIKKGTILYVRGVSTLGGAILSFSPGGTPLILHRMESYRFSLKKKGISHADPRVDDVRDSDSRTRRVLPRGGRKKARPVPVRGGSPDRRDRDSAPVPQAKSTWNAIRTNRVPSDDAGKLRLLADWLDSHGLKCPLMEYLGDEIQRDLRRIAMRLENFVLCRPHEESPGGDVHYFPIGNRAFKIRGFTLLEMLVVIAVVAMLVALLAPALAGAAAASRNASCLATLRDQAVASAEWANRHDGAWPGGLLVLDEGYEPALSGDEISPSCRANRTGRLSYIHASQFPLARAYRPEAWPLDGGEWRDAVRTGCVCRGGFWIPSQQPIALDLEPWHGWYNASFADASASRARETNP